MILQDNDLLLRIELRRLPDGKIARNMIMNPRTTQDALEIMQALINAQILLKIKIDLAQKMPEKINDRLGN